MRRRSVLQLIFLLALVSVWGGEIAWDWDLLIRLLDPQGYRIHLSY